MLFKRSHAGNIPLTANSAPVQINRLAFSWTAQEQVLLIDHFALAAHDRCFLQGPSGCGKSTLLGVIAGVNVPTDGEVCLLGQNLFALSAGQRDAFRADHIGFIFQMFNLLPYLSVEENVLLPCRFSRIRQENAIRQSGSLSQEARRLLADLGLGDRKYLERKVTDLSIGQQQRVAAARALIGGPQLLIADEPTSALDASSREAFIDTLFRECDLMNTALLFVSHDLSLAPLFNRSVELRAINRAAIRAEVN
jgi:putative ABC transport system ATP-binding protein